MSEPWTTQQMRDNAANWSLAGDAGMLNYLVQFSQGVIERAQNVTASLDTLGAQVDATQSELSNVCNEFNALAHSQFVENRVAEEEETASTSTSAETETPAHDGDAQAQEVLENSLAFLDEMFDVVEVPVGSDSEDEDDSSPANTRHTQLILKPINPYADRRLPHIIGSAQFEQDDNVGLVLTPSDDEDTEESPLADIHLARAQISESSSEADAGATFSLPSDNEDEIFMPKPPPIPQSLSSVSFADELARKLGGANEVTKHGGGAKEATKPTSKPAVPQNVPPLDQREPPSMFGGEDDEADDDWIFGASGRGTFSGGKGLFDDTTPETVRTEPVDEDDIFSSPSVDKPTTSTHAPSANPSTPSKTTVSTTAPSKVSVSAAVPSKTIPSKHGDLFGEDDAQDDLFSKSTSTGKRKSSTLLFSDEEDLFATPSRLNPPAKSPDLFSDPDLQPARVAEARASQAAQQVSRSAEVTGSADVSREESPKPQDTPPTKKLPAGAVSMFGGKSVFPASALRHQTSTSSEESVEPSSVSKSQQIDVTSKQSDISNVATMQQTKSANIAAISQEIGAVIAKQVKSTSNVAKTQQKEAKSAGSVVKSTPSKVAEPQVTKTKTVSKKAASLFDENDSEDDLFSSPRESNKPTPKEKVSLFGDSDTEDSPPKPTSQSKTNLFAAEKPAKTTETEIKSKKNKAKIFHNSDSEEDVVFSSASSGSSKSSKLFESSKTARHGLFDDDWLFNASKGESPGLFGTTSQAPDLFADVGDASVKIEKKKEVVGQNSTESDDLFSSDKNTKLIESNDLFVEPISIKSQVVPNVPNTKPEEKKKEAVQPKQAKEKPVSLFDSDEDDIFAPKTKKNLSSINKDLFVSDDLFAKPVEVKDNLFEDDLFASGSKTNLSGPKSAPNNSKTGPSEPKIGPSSSEAPEDDLFSSNTKEVASKVSDDLFSSKKEKVDSDVDIFSQKKDVSSKEDPISTQKKEIEPEEDLFSTQKSSSKQEVLPEKQKVSEPSPVLSENISTVPEQDKVQTEPVPEKVRREPPKSLNVSPAAALFSDTENKDVLFSDENLKPPAETVKKISPLQRGFALNINPLALLPGQGVKPYKQSISSEPEPEVKDVPEPTPRVAPEKPEIKPRNVKEDVPEIKPRSSETRPEKPEVIPRSTENSSEKPEIKPRSAETEKPEVKPRSAESVTEKPEIRPRNAEIRPETKPREKVAESQDPEIVVKSSPVEAAVSFEDTVISSIPVLHCPGKDRIKIPHKRKASTRRGRTSQNTSSPASRTEELTSDTSPAPTSNVTIPEALQSTPTSDQPVIESKTPNIKPKKPTSLSSPTADFMAPPLLDREPPPLPPSNPMSPSTDEDDVFDLPPEYLDDEDALFKPVPSLNFDAAATSLFPDTAAAPELFPSSAHAQDLFPSSEQAQDSLFTQNDDLFSSDALFSTPTSNDALFSTPTDNLFASNAENIFSSNTDALFKSSEKSQDHFASQNSPQSKEEEKKQDLSTTEQKLESHIPNSEPISDIFGMANNTEITPVKNIATSDQVSDIFDNSNDSQVFNKTQEKSNSLFTDQKNSDILFQAQKDNSESLFNNETDQKNSDILFQGEAQKENPKTLFQEKQEIIESSKDEAESLFKNKEITLKTDSLFGEVDEKLFQTPPKVVPVSDTLFSSSDTTPDTLFPKKSPETDVLFPGTNSDKLEDTFLPGKTSDSNTLFSQKSPEIDSLFQTKSPGTDILFSGTDSDSPKDTFSPGTSSIKKVTPALDDIFSSDALSDEDLFNTSTSNKSAQSTSKSVPAAKQAVQKPTPSLATQTSVSVPVKKTPPSLTAAKDIFAEDDDDDFFSSPVQPVSAPKSQTPKSQPQKSQTPKSQTPKSQVARIPSKGLFSDSDDEDLFSTTKSPSPLVKSAGSVAKSQPSTAKTAGSVAKSQLSTAKTAGSVAKSTSKSAVVKTSEDDFEDPLMAFQQD